MSVDSHDVTIDFGGGAGIFDQTYRIPEGTILGLIGPSGCGKSTTMRVALGLLTPQQGQISVLGTSPSAFTARDREQIGYIPQQFVLYPRLTVAENATFVASLYGMRTSAIKARLAELLDFIDMREARDRLGANLSGGMQRRLMLLGALMHNPTLIFADEPTAGIDPVLRGRFWDYFRKLRDEGRTLYVSTQYVGEAVYCDYVAVMRKGRILAIDTPAGLRKRVLGGEIIHISLEDERRTGEAVEHLRRAGDPVISARRVPGTDNEIHVTVADAGGSLPEVLNLLEDSDGPNMVVSSAQELQISYDDIFIRLMQREEAANG
nr:ABC transporter ATP-binding protein [Oscillochloris sp. ZM17-4]